MPAFEDPFEPVAYPGQAVRLEPSNQVFEVQSIEQMGEIARVDFGSATSGSDVTENNSEIIDTNDELEMNDDQLGQFLVNPISQVDIEVRQTGSQDQRFVNKNQAGTINHNLPPNQRLVWVYEDNVPQLIISNNQTWDMAKTVIQFFGFKFTLSPETTNAGRYPGEPASIPIDSLKKSPTEAEV